MLRLRALDLSLDRQRKLLAGLVAEVQLGERLPGPGEGMKPFRHGHARQLLGEVVREALAVVGCVQDAVVGDGRKHAVDVIEDRVLGDGVVGVVRVKYGERGIGDVVDAIQAGLIVQKLALLFVPPLVSVPRETLAERDQVKVRHRVDDERCKRFPRADARYADHAVVSVCSWEKLFGQPRTLSERMIAIQELFHGESPASSRGSDNRRRRDGGCGILHGRLPDCGPGP